VFVPKMIEVLQEDAIRDGEMRSAGIGSPRTFGLNFPRQFILLLGLVFLLHIH